MSSKNIKGFGGLCRAARWWRALRPFFGHVRSRDEKLNSFGDIRGVIADAFEVFDGE
jgi:hypothetical protein